MVYQIYCDNLLLPQDKNNLVIIGDLMNDASNNREVQSVFTTYKYFMDAFNDADARPFKAHKWLLSDRPVG